ncbi:hypothetical protein [Alteromonas sp. a30]|uniref:hypothetical protein n=1 Tax=Alteromonas sp. a30 TaxID=2730917 RepID=UPI00227F8E0A|nr:hypothetical protein [Alteromonas sp. a30]MCY7294219.1 hypothetical protein [Alteromonas sp. a30]
MTIALEINVVFLKNASKSRLQTAIPTRNQATHWACLVADILASLSQFVLP